MSLMPPPPETTLPETKPLVPAIGFWGASATNVLNMVGIGPFLTIPLALAAMGGPQAMLGWILGAFISLCDGMVWAELGSAMPFDGGPYHYMLQAFGPRSYGRLFSFLFLWQAIILGPISTASGAVGVAQYATYIFPGLHHGGAVALAAATCLISTALLYRNIRSIARLSIALSVIVLGSTIWIIVTGIANFHARIAFDFPAQAFHLSRGFFVGLGSATLIALYDYGGYYNICLLGAEVKHPKKTIPRSILASIVIVAVIYLVMNLSIIGVVPWREAIQSKAIVSDFMAHVYGRAGGTAIAVLILIASFGSVLAVLLGYSRIPYAAAAQGEFFSIFARLHPRGKFPYVSLLAMGLCSAVACLFSLETLITALIVTQTLLQFMGQCVAVMLLRTRKKEPWDSYRMPLYPVPALIALAGWTYIVVTSGVHYMELAGAFLLLGIAIFMTRAYREAKWPFADKLARTGGS